MWINERSNLHVRNGVAVNNETHCHWAAGVMALTCLLLVGCGKGSLAAKVMHVEMSPAVGQAV